MTKYIIKRLLLIIPNMLVVSLLVFLLCNITPADPGRLKLGLNATQEAVDQINHELGYDRPILVRYADWVWNAVRGDFGRSWYTNRPVMEELVIRLPNTLKLALLDPRTRSMYHYTMKRVKKVAPAPQKTREEMEAMPDPELPEGAVPAILIADRGAGQ